MPLRCVDCAFRMPIFGALTEGGKGHESHLLFTVQLPYLTFGYTYHGQSLPPSIRSCWFPKVSREGKAGRCQKLRQSVIILIQDFKLPPICTCLSCCVLLAYFDTGDSSFHSSGSTKSDISAYFIILLFYSIYFNISCLLVPLLILFQSILPSILSSFHLCIVNFVLSCILLFVHRHLPILPRTSAVFVH